MRLHHKGTKAPRKAVHSGSTRLLVVQLAREIPFEVEANQERSGPVNFRFFGFRSLSAGAGVPAFGVWHNVGSAQAQCCPPDFLEVLLVLPIHPPS
jgi:hypothetical protein